MHKRGEKRLLNAINGSRGAFVSMYERLIGRRPMITCSRGFFIEKPRLRYPGRQERQIKLAKAKRGLDVIPRITACNTPDSLFESLPGRQDEIRHMTINIRKKSLFSKSIERSASKEYEIPFGKQ
jgi:hypothetical protein